MKEPDLGVALGRVDALGLEVEVRLDETGAQRAGSPLTQLAEGHLKEDAITRWDQLHVSQAVRQRLAATGNSNVWLFVVVLRHSNSVSVISCMI